jgi:cytochrome P450
MVQAWQGLASSQEERDMAERLAGGPVHVRAAPVHPDPYSYYADLIGRGLFWDERQGTWVAASAEAVAAVFDSPICLTRPAGCPVPKAMANTGVAEIFARLVRLRDGRDHAQLKSAIRAALDDLDPAEVAALAREQAERLIGEIEPQRDGARLTRFLPALSARTMGALLGVPASRLRDVERWVGAYGAAAAAAVTGVPPVGEPVMTAGGAAARDLLALFSTLIEAPEETLSTRLAREAASAGIADRDVIAANAAGLLIQAQTAIASLMGLALLALARQPRARAAIAAGHAQLGDFMREVLRFDPGTQSTPRFVARDGVVAGQSMREGDCIIVLIAAANRDPGLNPDPHRFDMHRKDPRYFEFGRGAHACPGQAAAMQIAQIGVEALLALGLPAPELESKVVYRPSAHLRIPAFEA